MELPYRSVLVAVWVGWQKSIGQASPPVDDARAFFCSRHRILAGNSKAFPGAWPARSQLKCKCLSSNRLEVWATDRAVARRWRAGTPAQALHDLLLAGVPVGEEFFQADI